MRYATERDGENQWKNRLELCTAAIRDFDPDLLRTQEGLAEQYEDLRLLFSDFTPVGAAAGLGGRWRAGADRRLQLHRGRSPPRRASRRRVGRQLPRSAPRAHERRCTFHAFKSTTAGSRIDWILHSPAFRTRAAEIVRGASPRPVSDHYPVTAILEWKL